MEMLVRARVAQANAPAMEMRTSLHATEVELARAVARERRLLAELPRTTREAAEAAAVLDADAAAREASAAAVLRLLESGDAHSRRALAAAVVPATARAQQALAESARREALEDVMFQLRGNVSSANLDAVLRAIRQAATEQFMSSALILKIKQAEFS